MFKIEDYLNSASSQLKNLHQESHTLRAGGLSSWEPVRVQWLHGSTTLAIILHECLVNMAVYLHGNICERLGGFSSIILTFVAIII